MLIDSHLDAQRGEGEPLFVVSQRVEIGGDGLAPASQSRNAGGFGVPVGYAVAQSVPLGFGGFLALCQRLQLGHQWRGRFGIVHRSGQRGQVCLLLGDIDK